MITCQYNFPIQKFDKRSQVVSKTEYERYWKFLSVEYMTEASDDLEDDNIIVERKLTWRSESESIINYQPCLTLKSPTIGLLQRES